MRSRVANTGSTIILALCFAGLGLVSPLVLWGQSSTGFTYSATEGVRRGYVSGGNVFLGELVTETTTSDVIPVAAGSFSGVIGIAATTAPADGQSVTVGLMGAFQVSVDAPCNSGQFVTISASSAGYGHCVSVAGSSQVIGLAETSGSGSVTVLVDPLVSSNGASIAGGSGSNSEFLFNSGGNISAQSVMSFDSTSGAVPRVDFTNQSGWDSPVLFRNAQAPANSFTIFPVNTDGQFEIQQFSGGSLAALLNLDTDGHVFLYGAAGGGFATDINGYTCLAGINLSASPCSGREVYDADGKMVQYWGQPLAGTGIPSIVAVVDLGLAGNYGPTTIFTTNANPNGPASGGLYRLDVYAVAISGVPNSAIQFQVNYADADYGSESQNSKDNVSFSTGGDILTYSFLINAAAGTPIKLATNTVNTPVYAIHARLQAF